MSEYQYYEFQAVDRPLTKAEMAELRDLSSRATITPTRFVNVYNYGDFRGDPPELLERYFDAFAYVANWGTRWCMFRLPRRLVDPDGAARYCPGDGAALHVKGDHVIVEFRSDNEEGDGWIADEEAAGWLPSLLPLRAEIGGGDLRALYLGWLLCAQSDMLDDDAVEPPVPPGLGSLSAPLQALVEFLRLDEDLIAAAAERSPKLTETRPAPDALERWLRELPEAEKDALLVQVAQGGAAQVQATMLQRSRQAPAVSVDAVDSRRTVAQLLTAAGWSDEDGDDDDDD